MINRKLFKFGAPLVALAAIAGVLWLQPMASKATPGELAEVAIGYMKADKPQLAQQSFDEALRREPTNFRANYGAGLLAFREKRFVDAERYLKAAYQADPSNVDAILSLGAVYHKGKAYKQADALYQAIRKAKPDYANVYYNLGELEVDRRDLPRSKAYFEQYLKMAPQAADRPRVEKRLQLIEAHIKGNPGR